MTWWKQWWLIGRAIKAPADVLAPLSHSLLFSCFSNIAAPAFVVKTSELYAIACVSNSIFINGAFRVRIFPVGGVANGRSGKLHVGIIFTVFEDHARFRYAIIIPAIEVIQTGQFAFTHYSQEIHPRNLVKRIAFGCIRFSGPGRVLRPGTLGESQHTRQQ